MGNCCRKEDEINRYLTFYKILSTEDAYLLLRNGSIHCRLCKDRIHHAYISIVYCNYCRLVIGHEECILHTNKVCPTCNNRLDVSF